MDWQRRLGSTYPPALCQLLVDTLKEEIFSPVAPSFPSWGGNSIDIEDKKDLDPDEAPAETKRESANPKEKADPPEKGARSVRVAEN